jgi:type II secretory pathway predicted ATPase ExeA
MYAKHFGLHRRPFAVTADAPTCYPATAHERAYRQLLHALRQEEGFLLVTAEAGLGKTHLAHRLLHQLDSECCTSWLTNTHLADVTAMLQALLYDQGLPYQGQTEQELRLRLMDHLLKTYQDGRQALLVIDEAHHLRPEHLEELRLLGNLETREGSVVQVLLIGQPSLLDILRRRELAGLAQRISTSVRLEALDVHEAIDYLVHHLRAAGGKPERMVTDEALEVLARGAGGVPRMLNKATHLALQFAHEAGQLPLDAEAAIEALNELGLPVPEEEETLLRPALHDDAEMEEAA